MSAASEADPQDALAHLVREHRAGLAGLARREGLDAEDALDCVHDALCTFLQQALRGEAPRAPAEQARLLAGMVVNAARNRRRLHPHARPHLPLDEQEPSDQPSTEALVAHVEECVRLRGCVSRLCQPQRTVVMMRLLEERPGEDVAESLGLSRGYVDVLLHRAKAALRVCMAEGPG